MRRERYKRLIMFLASLLVIGLQTANFAWIWYKYYNVRGVMRFFYWRRGNWALIALYFLTVILVSKLFGALKVGYMRVLDVIIAQIFSVLLTNVLAYLQLALIGRWRFLSHTGPMVKLTFVNLLVVILWVVFMRWIYNTIYPPKSVILVYDVHNPEKLLKNIASRRDKYVIAEAVMIDKGLDFIKERIPQYETCILGDIPSHERNVLVKYCFERNIRCYCSPKISDIMLMSAEKIHMFDTPLLLMRNRGLTVEEAFVKRVLDIAVSILLTIVLSPVLLLIAVLVKCYDGGPVFYRQNRLTKDGKVFQIIKFRSMSVDSEKNGARLAAKGDRRVTPVGRVIRKIHFDELPQLFNIIKGDMSIVGPRPERPEIAAQYEKEIPEFSYRLKMKAGLTGYAQVYGKYNTKPYDKLKLDLTYIENYSLWLDFQLVAATVKVIFQKENTEGVDQSQRTALSDQDGQSRRQLEMEVQHTVDELKWQQEIDQMRQGDLGESWETAAALPNGVRAVDVMAGHEPGLLVSVIIPCYNAADTLPSAIDSALMQDLHFESSQQIGRGSLQRLEVLVLDDGSTDDIKCVQERYKKDARVHFYQNEKRLGVAKTRNRGALLARGQYIAYLDADDIWVRDKLKKQFARIYQTGCVLCCTGRELMTPDGSLTGHVIGVKELLTEKDLLRQNPINCSSVVALTSVVRQFPMICEGAHEDYITWMSIIRRYKTVCGVSEPLLYYRISESGKSGRKLKSARMTWRSYRCMGMSIPKSCLCFISYAVHGAMKYRTFYSERSKHAEISDNRTKTDRDTGKE